VLPYRAVYVDRATMWIAFEKVEKPAAPELWRY